MHPLRQEEHLIHQHNDRQIHPALRQIHKLAQTQNTNSHQQHSSLQQHQPMPQQIKMNPQDNYHIPHHQPSISNDSGSNDNNNLEAVMQQLMILVRETQDTDQMVQNNRDIYQDFVIQFQTRSRMLSGVAYADFAPQFANSLNLEESKRNIASIENLLRTKANELNQIRRRLINSQWSIFKRLLGIQDEILNKYLPEWHQEQQLMNNGVQSDADLQGPTLDLIQSWVEKIVEIIWRIKNQIKGLQLTLTDKPNVPFNTEDMESFVVYINRALENLILNTFVVEKQPPQVMKTNTRFTSTVRFLCGNKLNVQMINPTVKAMIMSEQNARTVIKCHKQLIENSWSFFEGQWPPQLVASNLNDSHHQTSLASAVGAAAQQHPTSGIQINSVHQQPLMAHGQQQQVLVKSFQSYSAYSPTTGPAAAAAHMNDTSAFAASPEQPMTLGDNQSPAHQQIFQQPHPPQQPHFQQTHPNPQLQQQQQQVTRQATAQINAQITNMTTHQQYGSITEIGYNPNAPASSKDFECSSEILNNNNVLEYHEASGQMISHFRNMQLKKIKRTEKKGTESVMDEKFILLFFTEFRIADDSFWPYSTNTTGATSQTRVKRGDLLFHILAFSLPVVVIVHGNQEPHAWATVTWHNAFAKPDDVLYTVPDRVNWEELGKVLSDKFHAQAGRGLSKPNLDYLGSKVCRCRADILRPHTQVTWIQFSKEPLSDRSFTFWEWFHSILKLTRDHLSPLWKADRIYGFICKKGCVDLLLGSGPECSTGPLLAGTFILRFSETELGGITMAWVSNSNELTSIEPSLNDRVQISQRFSPTSNDTSDSNVVMHLEPFVSKCLSTRPLADRIRDLKDLVYLYPNIPKDEAFEAYYTPIVVGHPTMRSGENYIKSMLVTTLTKNYPGSNTATHTEASVTPNSISQNSPEGYYQDSMMNEAIDHNYMSYDQGGDFYTIQ